MCCTLMRGERVDKDFGPLINEIWDSGTDYFSKRDWCTPISF